MKHASGICVRIQWTFIVLLILTTLPLISCKPQPPAKSNAENLTDNNSQAQQPAFSTDNITLESGFEIPQGVILQREPTYDDIVTVPGIGYGFKGGFHGASTVPGLQAVEISKLAIGDGFHIYYRKNIETRAGQIRYNLFSTELDGSEMYRHLVNIRLSAFPDQIQVSRVVEYDGIWCAIGIMIDIPPQVKPGDYGIQFLVFIDGKYYAELPCLIHVTG